MNNNSNIKKAYEPVVLKVVFFAASDILTASGNAGEGGYEDEI